MADSKIELRSEKVRHIIGEIPSRIVRYGITIITFVILGLLVGAYFILLFWNEAIISHQF